MSPYVTVERLDDVPSHARLSHYDELGERSKARFPSLVRNADGAAAVDARVAGELADVDVVKFTDYYRVEAQ